MGDDADMTSSIRQKINKALIYRLSSRFLQQILAFFFSIVLARLLSPAEFGVIAILNLIVHYANGFTNIGFGNALVQKTSIDNDHIDSLFTLDLTISLLMFALTWFAAEYIASFFDIPQVAPALKWMSLYYIITTFRHVPEALLRRELEFSFLSIASLVEIFLTYLLAIALAYTGYSYWSILIATLVVSCGYSVAIMFKLGRFPRFKYRHDKMKAIYSFGFWNFFRGQFELLVAKIDYLVIGKFLGATALGVYEKSFELTDRSAKGFSMPIGSVFFSAFSREKNDVLKVKDLFLQASGLMALVLFPVLFGLHSVAPYFVYSCLGDEWSGAVLPLQILPLAFFFKVGAGLSSNVNVAMGSYRANALLSSATSVSFAVLCFIFVGYGIEVICYLFFFYAVLHGYALFLITRKILELTVYEVIKSIIYPLGAGGIMVVSVKYSAGYFVDQYSFVSLLSLTLIGAGIYVALCALLVFMGKVRLGIVDNVPET